MRLEIENLVAVKLRKVKQTQCILSMVSETAKKLFPSVPDAKKLSPSGGKHNFV